jgi:hypothetical protein
MLLEYLIDENNIDIEQRDLRFVQSLIKGEVPQDFNNEKSEFSPIFIVSYSVDVRDHCKQEKQSGCRQA